MDMEGGDHGLIIVIISCHLPGGTEDNREHFQSVYCVFLPIAVAAQSNV
jgi:hypothetical protein